MSRMVIGHKWSRRGLAIAFLSLVASLGCTSLIGDDFTIELHAVKPRMDPPPDTPHIADVVLRARRR